MSEIAQTQDFQSFEQHLERIFKDLEDGVFITMEEIGDLRYACGLPAIKRKNPLLTEVFDGFAKTFGANK